MFSREESRQRKIDFWTAFGVYMRQHDSASGLKQKWVNYHTGVKGIYFRLDAEPGFARVAITLEQADPGIRALFYEQWLEIRTYLESISEATWEWDSEFWTDDGRPIARIHQTITGVNVYERNDWVAMFDFLAKGILALDSVWEDCGDVFRDLAE